MYYLSWSSHTAAIVGRQGPRQLGRSENHSDSGRSQIAHESIPLSSSATLTLEPLLIDGQWARDHLSGRFLGPCNSESNFQDRPFGVNH